MSIKVLSIIDNESGVPVIEGANGLSVSGNYMTLGGTLDSTTTISGGGYALDFGSAQSKLGSFDLISSQNNNYCKYEFFKLILMI